MLTRKITSQNFQRVFPKNIPLVSRFTYVDVRSQIFAENKFATSDELADVHHELNLQRKQIQDLNLKYEQLTASNKPFDEKETTGTDKWTKRVLYLSFGTVALVAPFAWVGN